MVDTAYIKEMLQSNDVTAIQACIEEVAAMEVQAANSDVRQQEQLVKLQIMLWSRILALQNAADEAAGVDKALTCKAYQNMGTLWIRSGDAEKALGQLTKAFRLEEDEATTLQLMSQAHLNLSQYDEAINHQELAIKKLKKAADGNASSDLSLAYGQLASVLEAKGDFADAVAILEQQTATIEGMDDLAAADMFSRLGVIQEKLGEYEKAVTNLTKAHGYYVKTRGEDHAKTKEVEYLLEMASSYT